MDVANGSRQRAGWALAALVAISAISGCVVSVVVRNLTDREFWDIAAQPIATAGTGALAVVAAGIAYAGVKLARKTTLETHEAQIGQQRAALEQQDAQHAAQLRATAELEEASHKRRVVHDAKLAASASIISLTTVSAAVDDAIKNFASSPLAHLVENTKVGGPQPTDPIPAAIRACHEARDACTATGVGLLILGERQAHEAIQAYTNSVGAWLATTAKDRRPISYAELKLIADYRFSAVATLAGINEQDLAGTGPNP